MRKLLHCQLVGVELTNRNNGQGRSWHGTARTRTTMGQLMSQFQRVPFRKRVDVVLTRIIGPGQREWDPDSIGRGNEKQIVDALVCNGWFVDDSSKWIRYFDYRQDDTQRHNGPDVLIEVFAI